MQEERYGRAPTEVQRARVVCGVMMVDGEGKTVLESTDSVMDMFV